ncbi:SOS response-associated peptidase [Draconibacterium sp.]|nr:SOS response-associated peptidase [Draconibacterium sp.]
MIQRGYLKRADFNDMPDAWVLKGFFNPSAWVITNEKPYRAKELTWGLIPSHTKNVVAANEIKRITLNAKVETLLERPSYRHLVGRKHCLIPVSGFYEWRDIQKSKYPYYIYMNDRSPFMLAGLWDTWTEPGTLNTHQTFTILTCNANELMKKIHNKKKRMPVIINKKDEEKWLTAKDYETILELCKPFDDSKMDAHTIDKLTILKKTGYNVPNVNEYVFYPETEQKTLFD